jgi:transposase-like protein
VEKEYQISKGQALEGFRSWAKENEEPVQLTFATADVVELAQQGLGDLLRQVGRQFIDAVMEAEVEQLVGSRWKPNGERAAYRWGSEEGFCIIDSQRVPLTRPRVRSRADREVALGSYELFQRASLLTETVWQKIMHGLSMRNYKEVVQQFTEAYGLEKSTISEHFIEASRRKLEQLMTRSLKDVQLCTLLVEGTCFKGESLLVAIGIDRLGNKLVLGLVQGATENASVVGELFSQLEERGLDFCRPLLYVIDGSRALRAAIQRHAGDAAFIQRCQIHKLRNVAEYVPEPERARLKFRMRAAYAVPEAVDARNALYRIHDESMRSNPSAADSLAEGLEETLTLQELGIRGKLRRSFSSTNIIESGFATVERICLQVKRWQGGDQRLRWVASALVYVESRWNRLQGHRQIPALINALESAYQLRLRERRALAQTSAA